jgi:hypothetical protein
MQITTAIYTNLNQSDQLIASILKLFPNTKYFQLSDRSSETILDYCILRPHLIVFCDRCVLQHIPTHIPTIYLPPGNLENIPPNRFSMNTLLYTDGITEYSLLEKLSLIVFYPITSQSTIFWQTPVKTEQYTAEKLTSRSPAICDFIYLAIPWATIIDKSIIPEKEMKIVGTQLSYLRKIHPTFKIVSCCQHIHYNKLTKIFQRLGISDLFISHKPANKQYLENTKIKIYGLPLYPVNIFDLSRSLGVDIVSNRWVGRKFLFSFVGAYMQHYLNPIRKTILSWSSSDKWIIQDTDIWHFEKDVYTQQVKGISLTQQVKDTQIQKTKNYNEILCQSQFSLCPVGAGPNTIRLWESICVESIPVIIVANYSISECFPKKWKNCKFIELDYNSPHLESPERLGQYLLSISKDEVNRMIELCRRIKNFCKDDFICERRIFSGDCNFSSAE